MWFSSTANIETCSGPENPKSVWSKLRHENATRRFPMGDGNALIYMLRLGCHRAIPKSPSKSPPTPIPPKQYRLGGKWCSGNISVTAWWNISVPESSELLENEWINVWTNRKHIGQIVVKLNFDQMRTYNRGTYLTAAMSLTNTHKDNTCTCITRNISHKKSMHMFA